MSESATAASKSLWDHSTPATLKASADAALARAQVGWFFFCCVGFVSRDSAREDYGVVLTGSLEALDLAVDQEATARLRAQLGECHGEFLGVIVNAVRASSGGYLRGNIKATHEYQHGSQAA